MTKCNTKARIHSFQSMGAVDGPGVRYVTFMQGCPLRCAYCHNPDTWDINGGQEYSIEEVIGKIKRFIPYIKNGGITISGGEPLIQPEFVKNLFEQAHELSLHTALDTSGIGELSKAEKVLQHTDLVLLDIKFTNEVDYKKYAKADFKQVVEFLKLCGTMKKHMWIRNVVVPTITDSVEHYEKLKTIIKPYEDLVDKLEFLPFRKLCTSKYENMGIEFPFGHLPECEKIPISFFD